MTDQPLSYELIDFGRGRKLERFGTVITDRPEVGARGAASLSPKAWGELRHGQFNSGQGGKGKWLWHKPPPDPWECAYRGAASWKVRCGTGPYKHVGIFPEQVRHWAFLEKNLARGSKYLNLFAYTGASSLAAAAAGADVYHVEASASVIKRAALNAEISGIDSIHWVRDDAVKFASRELRRGRKYDGISMDPPIFGRAKGGKIWRLEDELAGLVKTASELLNPEGFLVLNTYSPAVSIADMVKLCEKSGLKCAESGMLCVETAEGRPLNLSNYTVGRL